MIDKSPEEQALTKAGRRIGAIFYPSGDKTSFIEHKFSWVLNATDKEFGEFKKTQKATDFIIVNCADIKC